MATISARWRMLMLQNSSCARSQKRSSMLRRNHCVAPSFWSRSSISNGGQVELLLVVLEEQLELRLVVL